MKGKFEKRICTKEDIESLIMSRWNETFVNMKDIYEARKEFPNPEMCFIMHTAKIN